MPIAVDTNILWPIVAGTEPVASTLAALLQGYSVGDGLIVCAPVYAELLAGPGATIVALDAFLDGTGIAVDDALPLALWQEAGLAYRAYAERRLASAGLLPRRILADFIIGAHALHGATALLTLNQSDFERSFPSLPLIVPNLDQPPPATPTSRV